MCPIPWQPGVGHACPTAPSGSSAPERSKKRKINRFAREEQTALRKLSSVSCIYLEGLAERVQFCHTSPQDGCQGYLHPPRNHNDGPSHRNVSERGRRLRERHSLGHESAFMITSPFVFTLLSLGLNHSIFQINLSVRHNHLLAQSKLLFSCICVSQDNLVLVTVCHPTDRGCSNTQSPEL